jgi:hypothetical protein
MPCHPCHPSRCNGTKPLSRVGNLQGMEGMAGRGTLDRWGPWWSMVTPPHGGLRRRSFTNAQAQRPPSSSRSCGALPRRPSWFFQVAARKPRARRGSPCRARPAGYWSRPAVCSWFAWGSDVRSDLHRWQALRIVGRWVGSGCAGQRVVPASRGTIWGSPRPRSDRQFRFAHRVRNRRPVSSRGLISPKLRRTVISDI